MITENACYLIRKSKKEKIIIKDLSLLKITKVRIDDLYGFNIFFNYDNKHYLLHTYRDWDLISFLYEKNFYEDGSYDLKTLNHSYNDMLTDYLLDYKGEPWDEKRPPYKQIDKEHFVNALVEKGFCLYCKETN